MTCGFLDIAQTAGYHYRISSHLHHLPVLWKKPEHPQLKLNIDGAFYQQNNAAGRGGVLRTSQGDVIWAYAGPLHNCNSPLKAECLALETTLKFLINWQIPHLIIETDSSTLCNVISKKSKGHWTVKDSLVSISNSLSSVSYSIQHVYREGNCAADRLAQKDCIFLMWLAVDL
ncbi:hypothetical protein DH2020_015417 [Rehmannia glutinosa]|uniref:RNase H type-1 domain-containing protein n=1 Tax=Rehmannia glutinosa TaxID=99300 RepID=A0ABR0WTE9_REHGL